MVLRHFATYSRLFGWCGEQLGQGEPSLVEVMMVLISAAKYRFSGGHVSNHFLIYAQEALVAEAATMMCF